MKNNIFGGWAENIRDLEVSPEPFDHLVIDNFFKDPVAT